jgi:hypothetical protein
MRPLNQQAKKTFSVFFSNKKRAKKGSFLFEKNKRLQRLKRKQNRRRETQLVLENEIKTKLIKKKN